MRGLRHGNALFAVGLSLLTGCADSDQVWLGRAELTSEQCVGCADAGAGSAVEPPSAGPEPTTLVQVAEIGRCDVPVTGELRIDLQITANQPECGAPGTCYPASREQVVPALDGGVWLLGSHWLAHFSADGTLLGDVLLPAAGVRQLAVDDHGQAWLALRRWDADAEVLRFDAAVYPIGQPIVVHGHLLAVAAVPEQGTAIVSGAPPSTLTLFDYDGHEVWSQSAGTGYDAKLAVGPQGLAVLTPRAREYEYAGVAVNALAADGSALWSMVSATNIHRSVFDNYVDAEFDGAGNLLLALTPPGLPGGGEFPGPAPSGLWDKVDVESIDATGRTRWVVRLSSSLNVAMSVNALGEVFVAEYPGFYPRETPEVERTGVIAVLSSDGQTCRRLRYEGIDMVNDLVTAPDGRLWYLAQNHFGRFALPNP